VGEAIKGRKREDLFIVTKIPTYSRKYAKPPDPETCLDISLKRMGLSYLDGLLLHNADISAMSNKKVRSFLEKKVREGVVRFAGVNFHEDTTGHIEEALKDDLFSIIVFCHESMNVEKDMSAVRRAARRGRAITAMITLPDGNPSDDLPGDEILKKRAAFKIRGWPDLKPVFSSKCISNVLVTIKNYQQIDSYLEARGKRS